MGLTEEQEIFLKNTYMDPAVGLRGAAALYDEVKKKGMAYDPKTKIGITSVQVKEWYKSLDTTQVQQKSSGYHSFIPEKPLSQFQIDLVEMKKKWSNNGYRYCFVCVDTFSKIADMVPMRKKDTPTSVQAMIEIFKKMGKPKTIYADQGSEFTNNLFQKLLQDSGVEIIFSTSHAPFVESFNSTMKSRMYKYMAVHKTSTWTEALPALLSSYNSTKHTSTGFAPNDINQANQEQARINMLKRAHKKNYEEISEGTEVRLAKVTKFQKGYDPHFTDDTFKVQKDQHDGLYQVNGKLYTRKDLKPTGTVRTLKKADPVQARKQVVADKIGKAQYSPNVRDIAGDMSSTKVANILASPAAAGTVKARPSRAIKGGVANYAVLAGKQAKTKK